MLAPISYNTSNNYIPSQSYRNLYYNYQKNKASVAFHGKSDSSLYKSVFEYMAAEIFDGSKKYPIDGSMLSASKIKEGIKILFDEGKVYLPFKKSVTEKIRWKSYIPKDVREFSIAKINEAREARMSQWKSFLENPEQLTNEGTVYNQELVRKIKNDKSLRVVIWNAITSEIKDNNRHIPVPFDQKALLETIRGFEKIAPKDRKVRCSSPTFLEIYTHRLRDNVLMDMKLSGDGPIWVKIPSLAHNRFNKEKNISNLEVLSSRNWCTRSSIDKAQAALEDGDFYIYLKRGKSELWEPLVGMTSCKGKIDQIQGVENNNIVPINLIEEIKKFITTKKLKCQSGILDEGPKATQAIMISEKLNDSIPGIKPLYTFAKAIKENDEMAMFKFLGIQANKLDDGLIQINQYRPSYSLEPKKGISVPYSMFGLNEDDLLKNVKVIDGNLVLDAKLPVFYSRITQFPPNLERVNGKIICTASQYEKFKTDIDRVLGGNKSNLIIHTTF